MRDRVKQLEKQNESPTTHKLGYSAESLRHFRQLPIIPHIDELISDERSVLYPNIINGKYDTLDQYLNVRQINQIQKIFFFFVFKIDTFSSST